MRVFYYLSISLVKILARLLFRMKAYNRDNIPAKGPFILACNHISYYDPPLVGSFIKREIHFMAKKELFRNRLFGALITYFNSHPVNRNSIDKTAIEMVKKVLNSEQGIIIFPEGTRSKTDNFLPSRPGVGMLAIANMVPVIPAYINGSNDLIGCLLGKTKLAVIYGRPIAREEISQYNKDKDGYHRLANDIMSHIKALKEEFLNKMPEAD
jgi:1-acyl-sn-glycerol-3-phosphate acyltransferase